MRATLSRWCMLRMHSNLWETTQTLVRIRSITIPSRSDLSWSNFGPTVFQPSTPARNLVTPRPYAQRPNRALQRLLLHVPVVAFSSPSSVGAAPRAQPGARPLLYHVAPTSARSRNAMLVLQRRLVSIPTYTKPTHAKLCIRMTWLALPSPTSNLLSW